MRTFILFWDPKISNDKGDRRSDFIDALKQGSDYHANWAVWDWLDAGYGDRFYKVICGNPDPSRNGIVESGTFVSDPYIDEDWSGKGREVHYCDLKYDAMCNHLRIVPLTADELSALIPEFDWTGGHSGRLLKAELAEKLAALWAEKLVAADVLGEHRDDTFLDYDFENEIVSLENTPK